jgi:NAD(P)-dependent dehydrogenase (short-subunit alcohol dehydrogenase family)
MGNQVVVNGAGSELGRAAIAAVSKARGMQLVGAVDSQFDGQDAGQVLLDVSASFLQAFNEEKIAFKKFLHYDKINPSSRSSCSRRIMAQIPEPGTSNLLLRVGVLFRR